MIGLKNRLLKVRRKWTPCRRSPRRHYIKTADILLKIAVLRKPFPRRFCSRRLHGPAFRTKIKDCERRFKKVYSLNRLYISLRANLPMRKYIKRIRVLYLEIIHSIAFYPTFIALALFALSLITMYLESTEIGIRIDPYLRLLIDIDRESARSFLSAMAGGMISLMVFSFSMVMVMLNQASSDFSPRILPGIISQKSHQMVLGVYLGAIIYLLINLINIGSNADVRPVSVPSILLGLILTLGCLALFVYFIHSISTTIQIDTILKEIYESTMSGLEREMESNAYREDAAPPTSSEWREYACPESGYFQQIQESVFLKLLTEQDRVVQILEPMGAFLLKGTPLIRISGPEDPDEESEIREELTGGLIFQNNELPKINFLYGFKQITEIAIKALSPGINDPGTAVNAMDYLSDLLAVRMELADEKALYDDENRLRVSYVTISFEDLLYYCFAEIRAYGKNDPIVIHRLLSITRALFQLAPTEERKKTVLHQARMIAADAKYYIHNTDDRIRIARMLKSMEGMEEAAAELYRPEEEVASSSG